MSLKTLIKLAKRELDEKRKKMVKLEESQQTLLNESERLAQELLAEQGVATQSLEAQFAYSDYAQSVAQKQHNLTTYMTHVDEQVAALNDEMAEAFAELKRYETLQSIRDKREADELARKEAIELDEIGIDGYMRKKDTG